MEDALRDQQPSGLGVGATIAIAVCSSVVCVLAAVALGLFMLKRSRRKGPSTNNEPADVELKQGEPSPGHPQG